MIRRHFLTRLASFLAAVPVVGPLLAKAEPVWSYQQEYLDELARLEAAVWSPSSIHEGWPIGIKHWLVADDRSESV